MIKAILFDYDGVISQGVDVMLPAKRLAENISISEDRATELIKSIWDDYSTGRSSSDEVWNTIESQLGVKVPDEKRNIWHTWSELESLPYMLDFVSRLKSKGYQVGLLSNVFKETADIIRDNGGYDNFDFTILSCEVGSRKPEREVYAAAMKKLPGIQPGEVLFLDDREHSIAGAKDFGLKTIHVTNHKEAVEQVNSLLDSTSI